MVWFCKLFFFFFFNFLVYPTSYIIIIIVISKPNCRTRVYPRIILLLSLLFIEEHDCVPCLSTILHSIYFFILLYSVMLSKFICQMGTHTELWHYKKTLAAVQHFVSCENKELQLQTAEETFAGGIQTRAVTKCWEVMQQLCLKWNCLVASR